MEQNRKHTKLKTAFIILLVLALILSNVGWLLLYQREQGKLKNAIIPTLSEDYFTRQLVLVKLTKDGEGKNGYGNTYPTNIAYNAAYPSAQYEIQSHSQQSQILNAYGKPLDVPAINQNPDYPNGCEAAAATMLLQYYGYKVSLSGFIDKYLKKEPVYEKDGVRYGPSPEQFYAGDPATNRGWGAFEPAVALSIQKFFDANAGKDHEFVALTNSRKLSLESMSLNRIFPFIIWTTADYSEADEVYEWKSYDGEHTYTYPKHSHVVVVTGADENYYYINDSLTGEKNKKVEKDKLSRSFDSMGRQAVYIDSFAVPSQIAFEQIVSESVPAK